MRYFKTLILFSTICIKKYSLDFIEFFIERLNVSQDVRHTTVEGRVFIRQYGEVLPATLSSQQNGVEGASVKHLLCQTMRLKEK